MNTTGETWHTRPTRIEGLRQQRLAAQTRTTRREGSPEMRAWLDALAAVEATAEQTHGQ